MPDKEDLRKKYKNESTKELQRILRSKSYTQKAKEVALEELVIREVEVSALKIKNLGNTSSEIENAISRIIEEVKGNEVSTEGLEKFLLKVIELRDQFRDEFIENTILKVVDYIKNKAEDEEALEVLLLQILEQDDQFRDEFNETIEQMVEERGGKEFLRLKNNRPDILEKIEVYLNKKPSFMKYVNQIGVRKPEDVSEVKDIIGKGACPNCGTDNDPSAKYCASCGEELTTSCPRCGKFVKFHNRYCGNCGLDIRFDDYFWSNIKRRMNCYDSLKEFSSQHQSVEAVPPEAWHTYDKAVKLDKEIKNRYDLEFERETKKSKTPKSGVKAGSQKDASRTRKADNSRTKRGRTPYSSRGQASNKSLAYSCPNCGSSSTQKLSVFYDQSSDGGCGCAGCLLFIIILLIAPGVVLLPILMGGMGLTAAFAEYSGTLIGATIVGVILAIIVMIYRKNTYVCKRCGTKFRP